MANRTTRASRRGAVRHAWMSKPVGIAAAVILVAVLAVVGLSTALGVFAPVQNGSGGSAATHRPTAASGPCDVPVGSLSDTPPMPSDLRWKTGQDGINWPVSATVGPTRTVDGFPACFARSPLGAALAATTGTYEQYGDHSVRAALGFYIQDSPGKEKDIAASAAGFNPQQMRSSGLNPAGFSVESFSKDQAVVTLVYSFPSSSTGYFGMPYTMVWTGGDWKISVLDNGTLFAGRPTTPVQGSFVPWTGQQQ